MTYGAGTNSGAFAPEAASERRPAAGAVVSRKAADLSDVLAALRIAGWISKLPALILATYASGAAIGYPSGDVCYAIGFTALHLSLGYAANDLADWRYDIAAGNGRSAHARGRRFLTILVLVLIVANLGYLLGGALSGGYQQAGFGLATIVLGFMYSFPPRMKGRGAAGVCFSSYIQWVSPMIFLLLAPGVQVSGVRDAVVVVAVLVWLAATGCHGALRHQVRDLTYDLDFTRTFAVHRGSRVTRRLLTVCRVGVFVAAASLLVGLPSLAGLESALALACFSTYHLFYYKRLERK